jgi:heme/copper-type cytochrome/quinol oxidase subunit 4
MIAYAVFVLCVIFIYINHLKILQKMNNKRDYDPNKVANVALIIVAGVAFFISLIVITNG